ncbi:MAG TPA: hypothetical protein VMD29_05090, partial [Terracidiphilus sp.]|nr:hypothetical protein [Terracidiphilus sp.]
MTGDPHPSANFGNLLGALLANEPVVFIAGSGISLGYPAFLPGSSDVLRLAIEQLREPKGLSANERSWLHRRILTEVFFQVLLDYASPDDRKRILSPWEWLGDAASRPTVLHYLIVHLSALHQVPIITPNFDELFERAASDLGLGVDVQTPREDSTGWHL